jgi:hypothetical protein
MHPVSGITRKPRENVRRSIFGMPHSLLRRLPATVLAPYSAVKFLRRTRRPVFSISVPPQQLRPATDLRRRKSTASVVARFSAAFTDIAIDIAWDSVSLNAQADRLGSLAEVVIYGGLVRHRHIRWQGLALAIAHEIGHLKGGPPTNRWYDWLSTDGRADEWATTVGLPTVFRQAAPDVARAGADQLFGALADLVDSGTAPRCETEQPCLACRARAFGSTGRIASRRCEKTVAPRGTVASSGSGL